MSVLSILLIGLFLPLFPLSIIFNQALKRVKNPLARSGILLIWPVPGILASVITDLLVTPWMLTWAALTALLYGFRLLTQREIHGWIGFLATAVWSLLWFPLVTGISFQSLVGYALAISIPLVMLAWLAVELEQRFGVAYTHLYRGLPNTMPRFSGVLVFCILAAIATPVFPSFFIMLKVLLSATPALAIIILLAWLTWSWAGIRLLQGLLVGEDSHYKAHTERTDINKSKAWSYALILVVLTIVGLYVTGDMS
uniref:Uncharacterized protein n=1 Tax=uncultured Thiotrichaceae bacterium TaxID=298394 RepID=A0A6S6UMS3_9GAMM|nr:MAG: Unknown protein [uncultured Thiotrichaceae bacterium]